jgi:predicted PurR-regulated permease PerM
VETKQQIGAPARLSPFMRRVLAVVGILLLALLGVYFLWSVGEGILVIFAAVLFAIFLDGLARVICRYTPARRGVALLGALVCLAVLAFGGFWLGGSSVAAQAPQLGRQLSKSIDKLHDRIAGSQVQVGSTQIQNDAAGQTRGGNDSGTQEVLSYGKKMIGNLSGVLSVTVGMITDAFIIFIVGLYFAVSPGFYVESSALLVPPDKREHAIQVLDTIGHALRRWFLGRIMAMALVGVLTIAGLYAIGVKLALLLGIIAGLMTFVPYLGAIASAVPAVLVGFTGGPLTALYVIVLFIVVHIVEGYVFTPLVQKRIVHVAPAFLLIAQLLAGLFAGIFGIFLATPIAIALTIGVQKFYIQDTLGESPHILGDETADQAEEEEKAQPTPAVR